MNKGQAFVLACICLTIVLSVAFAARDEVAFQKGRCRQLFSLAHNSTDSLRVLIDMPVCRKLLPEPR